jgi:hypothetical protein
MSGIPIVSKYPGVATRISATGGSTPGGAGLPSTRSGSISEL